MLIADLDSDSEVQLVSTALLLSELGADASAAVPRLAAILDHGASREVKWAAAYALGRIGDPARTAIPALVRALEHPDADVRDEAALALDRVIPFENFTLA